MSSTPLSHARARGQSLQKALRGQSSEESTVRLAVGALGWAHGADQEDSAVRLAELHAAPHWEGVP